MGIQTAATYIITSGTGNLSLTETRQERSQQHDTAPETSATAQELLGMQDGSINLICLESIIARSVLADADAYVLK